MAEINWTQEAQQWLEDIFEFVAAENPKAASRVVSDIYSRAQILNSSLKSDTATRLLNAKSVSCCTAYRIAYLIKDDGNLDVLGVFHGALDISRYSL